MLDLVEPSLLSRFESYQIKKIQSLSWPQALTRELPTLLSGGKYLRSQLFFKILSSEKSDCLYDASIFDLGLAIEWVHSFSLVHDDLPCMDDDDFRRSKPTAHRLMGEAQAVLLGDALLVESTRLVLKSTLDQALKLQLLDELTFASSGTGLIGGQSLELTPSLLPFSENNLAQIHAKKTGALFAAASAMGAIFLEKPSVVIRHYREWGMDFGILYQLIDDACDGDGFASIKDAKQLRAEILNRIESLSDRAKALGFNVTAFMDLFLKVLGS